MNYEYQYQIIEALSDERGAIESAELYNVDPNKMLVDGLVRMSQPLSDGSPSPLSSRSILSAEAIILSNLLIQLQYFGHELNLFPDSLFVTFFRLLGLTKKKAIAPTMELEFAISREAIADGREVYVQSGTKIRSKFFADRTVTIVENASPIDGSEIITAIGRLDRLGKLNIAIRDNEFSLLPLGLSRDFESVTNKQIISVGRDDETVSQTIERSRSLISRPGNRAVTARDYQEIALNQGGATAATVLPRYAISPVDRSVTYPSDVISVVVYPETAVESVRAALLPVIGVGTRLQVEAARVVPIDGRFEIGIDPNLSETEAFSRVATAIVDYINPPNGIWGDRGFLPNLAAAIERVQGVYSVTPLLLKHAETDVKFGNLTILPHDLLEIQDSMIFDWKTM